MVYSPQVQVKAFQAFIAKAVLILSFLAALVNCF